MAWASKLVWAFVLGGVRLLTEPCAADRTARPSRAWRWCTSRCSPASPGSGRDEEATFSEA